MIMPTLSDEDLDLSKEGLNERIKDNTPSKDQHRNFQALVGIKGPA